MVEPGDRIIDLLVQHCSGLIDERDVANQRVLELERRMKLQHGTLFCGGCGGPHRFDTSIPNELWNEVIRAKGISEYLCTSCIVREFALAGKDFTATLWSDDFNGVSLAVTFSAKGE